MAKHLSAGPYPGGKSTEIEGTLSRSVIRRLVHPSFRSHELPTGDLLIVADCPYSTFQLNQRASSVAGLPVWGDAILCTTDEIA